MRVVACISFRKCYDLLMPRRFMSGELRKGERIPRRAPPEFEEVEALLKPFHVTAFLERHLKTRTNTARLP